MRGFACASPKSGASANPPAAVAKPLESELSCKRFPRRTQRWAEGEEQSAPRLSRAVC